MKRYLGIIFFYFCFLIARPAFADMSPIEAYSNSLTPVKESTVVMDHETVNFTIKEDGSMDRAIATFWMKNPTDQEVETTSIFPASYYFRDELEYAKPETISVKIDGKSIVGKLKEDVNILINESNWFQRATSTGYVFPLKVPANQTVKVEVQFDPAISSDNHSPYLIFNYVLATGAGWDGPINSAVITVNYPYPIEGGWVFANATGTVSGKSVSYVYNNLNPKPEDDIKFMVLPPDLAKTIIEQRVAIKAHPEDPALYDALASTYRSADNESEYWKYSLKAYELRYGSIKEPATGKAVLELARLYSDDWVFMDNGVVSDVQSFMNLMDYTRNHQWKESDAQDLTELHEKIKKNDYGYGYLHPEDYDFLPGADATTTDVVVGRPLPNAPAYIPRVITTNASASSNVFSGMDFAVRVIAYICAMTVLAIGLVVFLKRK